MATVGLVASFVDKITGVLNGRYVIDREIGRGGMATVYLARDLKHDGAPVAVKVLLPDLGYVVGPERFKREIDVASRFSHPNILALNDSGEFDGLLYYVMPFVEGESLRSRLDREGQLGIDEAVALTIEVAEALDYAHRANVVHRDIKPENILLEEGHALVADFGIARAVASAGDEKLTQTGVTLGTPKYMSPEQAAADKRIDGRSDVYSLACVLYEMLAGQPPFVGPNAQAIIARHALDTAPALSIVRPTMPPALERVVMKALSKVPADRFATASDFATALRSPIAATAGWAVPEGTATLAAQGMTAGRGLHRWTAAAFVLAIALLGAAGAAWRHWFAPARPEVMVGGLDPRHVAVLYFDDQTAGHQLGYLADGLTDALIGQLDAVRSLKVISSAGVAHYRGDSVAPDSIARALAVGTLVRGAVDREGAKLRVTVHLLDGASGAEYQRSAFELPAGNVLAVRDTLAAQVGAMIRKRLGQEITLRDQRAQTTNPDAWALVQLGTQSLRRGEQLMASADTTALRRNFASADSTFAQAARLDAGWPTPPIARATVAYRLSRFYGGDPQTATRWIDSALAQDAKALALAPTDPDALEIRGTLRYWRWLLGVTPDAAAAAALLDSARLDLEASVGRNPEQASAWGVLASLYYQKNDVEGAKLAARRAYEEDAYLSNADVILWRLFAASYDLEQFTEAAHWCDVTGRRFPTDVRHVECQLRLMATKAVPPDPPQAWRLADSLTALSAAGDQPFARLQGQVLVAGAMAHSGLADSARHILARVNPSPDVDPTHDLDEDKGVVYLILGDKDQALRELKRYLAANPARTTDVATDGSWQWRSLRDDPRFQALFATGATSK
jgi:eukaryotic-like serine/threonine-protein kinase